MKHLITVVLRLLWLLAFSFFAMRSSGVFAADNRCGPHCLLVAARACGHEVTLADIDCLFPDTDRQASISELEDAAHELGLTTLGVHWNDRLPRIEGSSAILPIGDVDGRRHFVVVLRSDGEHVLLLDFPGEAGWLRTSELISRWKWDGNALHVAISPSALAAIQPNLFRDLAQYLMPVLVVVFTLGYLGFVRTRRVVERRRQKSLARSGMSLIEVLVAMSILGLLVALFAPAIQSSREAARRVQCRNNLKQLSLACQAHHGAHQQFPAASIPFVSSTGPPNDINLSVHARLLPFLDQTPLFKKLDQKEDGLGSISDPPTSSRNPTFIGMRMSLFECPTDRVPAGATNYRVCIGTGPGWWDSWSEPPLAKVGAFASTSRADRDMLDGLSSTAFFSEKLVGDQNPGVYSASRDYFLIPFIANMSVPSDAEVACQLPVGAMVTHVSFGGSAWLFSGYDHTWYNHALLPNASTPDCSEGRSVYQALVGAFSARSLHDGGVNVAFGDGAVRFMANSIDLAVWRAISSRKGRETVALDF